MSSVDAPRILINRLGSTADVILTLPVACALRDHFPDAWIGWVVGEASSHAIRAHRCVDEALVLPSDWLKSVSRIRHTRSKLRSFAPDIAIDLERSTASTFATRLSGAARRLGYAKRSTSAWRRFTYTDCVSPVFSHLTDRSLELLTPLGIHTPQVRWDFPMSPLTRTWATRWRSSVRARNLAIMSTSGDWKSKRWEADRFASTARYLRDRYGYQTALICETYDERLMAEEIVTRSVGAAFLAPETDLMHLAALIESADLFLGGDCHALHLAVAVGTRAVGLYGVTRPSDRGPYGHIALQLAYESGSRRHQSRVDNTAMKTIGVEHVCQVIDELESNTTSARIAA